MKLYYSPGACSLSPHIALNEAGLSFETVAVNIPAHQTADGVDYYTLNPKGYVPLLVLDNGERLTEGPAIIQYIADLVPEKNLAPANGTMARYRLQEWLNFLSTEVHKSFSPLFSPVTPEETKTQAKARVLQRLQWVDGQLEGKSFLLGDSFSVADGYLFTLSNWAPKVGIDIEPLKHLGAYRGRVAARPAVQATLKAEGLLKG